MLGLEELGLGWGLGSWDGNWNGSAKEEVGTGIQ